MALVRRGSLNVCLSFGLQVLFQMAPKVGSYRPNCSLELCNRTALEPKRPRTLRPNFTHDLTQETLQTRSGRNCCPATLAPQTLEPTPLRWKTTNRSKNCFFSVCQSTLLLDNTKWFAPINPFQLIARVILKYKKGPPNARTNF